MRFGGIFLNILFISTYICEFIPSNEWKKVDPNLPLPPYLEYKLDLEKGESYARLPQDLHLKDNKKSKENTPAEKLQDNGPKFTIDSDNKYREKIQTMSQNKDFLDAIRNLDDTTTNKNATIKPKSKEEIEELKQFMDVLFPELKSESQLMKDILDNFKNNSGDSITLLEDLSDILHSFDVAVDFNHYNGYEYFMNKINEMITNAKNDPPNIKTIFNATFFNKMIHIFIPSAQNNDKVKDILISLNYDSFLLQCIDFIFSYNLTESHESCLYQITLSMNTFLKYCPICTTKMLTNPNYNHTFGKLLSLPYYTNTWKNTLSLLSFMLKQKNDSILEDDIDYLNQLKNMSVNLERILIKDSICQKAINLANDYNINNALSNVNEKNKHYSKSTLLAFDGFIKLLDKQLCPNLRLDEAIKVFEHNMAV